MWLKIISLKLFLILAFFVGTTFYETALGEEAVVSPNPLTPIYRVAASYPQISAESFVGFDALTGEIITAVNFLLYLLSILFDFCCTIFIIQ